MRPGTLSTIKPNLSRKKSSGTGGDSNKIQTTLNFERIPRKSSEQTAIRPSAQEQKDKVTKPFPSPKEEAKITSQPKTPVIPKPQVQKQIVETPKSYNSTYKSSEPRKLARTTNRSQTSLEKVSWILRMMERIYCSMIIFIYLYLPSFYHILHIIIDINFANQ